MDSGPVAVVASGVKLHDTVDPPQLACGPDLQPHTQVAQDQCADSAAITVWDELDALTPMPRDSVQVWRQYGLAGPTYYAEAGPARPMASCCMAPNGTARCKLMVQKASQSVYPFLQESRS